MNLTNLKFYSNLLIVIGVLMITITIICFLFWLHYIFGIIGTGVALCAAGVILSEELSYAKYTTCKTFKDVVNKFFN